MQLKQFRGKNRAIQRAAGEIRYIYHSTIVVLVYPGGHIRLDSGYFRSVTTMNAMNQAANQDELGFHVFADKGDWFVTWRGEQLPFADGMILK